MLKVTGQQGRNERLAKAWRDVRTKAAGICSVIFQWTRRPALMRPRMR
jgi:hypothetical protein